MLWFFETPLTLLIGVISLVIALGAQAGVTGAYKKYSKVQSTRGMTGSEVARRMVQGLGVEVVQNNCGRELSDHFDPRKKTIGLSPDVYNGTSVAAIGIAAHEAGHALQYDQGYAPIKLRNGILPIAQLASTAEISLVLIGLFFGGDYGLPFLIDVGILLFIAVLAFQLITLPVEFNASRRAMAALDNNVYLSPEESTGAKKVLRAAAMTYVAAVAVSALQLLRLLLISGRRR